MHPPRWRGPREVALMVLLGGFECEQCGSRFFTRDDRRWHRLIHLGAGGGTPATSAPTL